MSRPVKITYSDGVYSCTDDLEHPGVLAEISEDLWQVWQIHLQQARVFYNLFLRIENEAFEAQEKEMEEQEP